MDWRSVRCAPPGMTPHRLSQRTRAFDREDDFMEEPYFHVGILVRDVEAARADFTARLGVEFEPVHRQKVATGETTRFCYSLQGPPYLELVEMTGTGSWSPEQPEGFHHIGLSDPSVPS